MAMADLLSFSLKMTCTFLISTAGKYFENDQKKALLNIKNIKNIFLIITKKKDSVINQTCPSLNRKSIMLTAPFINRLSLSHPTTNNIKPINI